MIVVSDTTPLNYLILIGQIDLLPRLYGQVIVPTTVVHELKHLRAPESVRSWMASPHPGWRFETSTSMKNLQRYWMLGNWRHSLSPSCFMQISCSWTTGKDTKKRPAGSCKRSEPWRPRRGGITETGRSTEGSRTVAADQLFHLSSSLASSQRPLQAETLTLTRHQVTAPNRTGQEYRRHSGSTDEQASSGKVKLLRYSLTHNSLHGKRFRRLSLSVPEHKKGGEVRHLLFDCASLAVL